MERPRTAARASWDYAVIYGSFANLLATGAALTMFVRAGRRCSRLAVTSCRCLHNVLMVVAVWRSAARHQGDAIWARLARGAIIVWAAIATLTSVLRHPPRKLFVPPVELLALQPLLLLAARGLRRPPRLRHQRGAADRSNSRSRASRRFCVWVRKVCALITSTPRPRRAGRRAASAARARPRAATASAARRSAAAPRSRAC